MEVAQEDYHYTSIMPVLRLRIISILHHLSSNDFVYMKLDVRRSPSSAVSIAGLP